MTFLWLYSCYGSIMQKGNLDIYDHGNTKIYWIWICVVIWSPIFCLYFIRLLNYVSLYSKLVQYMSWRWQYYIYCRFPALNWQCCFLLAILVSLRNFKEIALFNLVIYLPKAISPIDLMNRLVLDFGITRAFQEVSIAWAITRVCVTCILYL